MNRRNLLKSIPLAGFGIALPGIALSSAHSASPTVAEALAAFDEAASEHDAAQAHQDACLAAYDAMKPVPDKRILSSSSYAPFEGLVTSGQIVEGLRDPFGKFITGPHFTKPQFSVPYYVASTYYLDREIERWEHDGYRADRLVALRKLAAEYEAAEKVAQERSGIYDAIGRCHDADSILNRACQDLIDTPAETALDVALKAKARVSFLERMPGFNNVFYDSKLLVEVAAMCGGDL